MQQLIHSFYNSKGSKTHFYLTVSEMYLFNNMSSKVANKNVNIWHFCQTSAEAVLVPSKLGVFSFDDG